MEDRRVVAVAMLIVIAIVAIYIFNEHKANKVICEEIVNKTGGNLKEIVNGTGENYVTNNYIANATIWPAVRACISFINDTHEITVCKLRIIFPSPGALTQLPVKPSTCVVAT